MEDRAFLVQLYLSTRWEELSGTGWSDGIKTTFLRQQFQFQDAHYSAHYAEAARGIVMVDGEPGGRLYLFHMQGDVRLVDISLLPEHRAKGLGTRLIQAVQAMALEGSNAVSLHVAQFNPARRLYERLGFQCVGGDGIHLRMTWNPV